MAASKLGRILRRRRERNAYGPGGEGSLRPASAGRTLRPLGLVHPDVFEANFSERFRALFPQAADAAISEGDRALIPIVDLLGSGPTDLGRFSERPDLRMYPGSRKPPAVALKGRVPWHFDFKSGVGWDPSEFFSDIRYGAPGADVKVPWELSRCRHFVALGQAYRLTRNESYAGSFCSQLEDWIRSNPPKYGVNWACPMDVALRACNWLLAWELFRDSPSLTPTIREKIGPSLWEHGNHVAGHLEWGADVSTNHYLSNLLGLAYIGRALDEKKWETTARREFRAEILRQTFSDGLDYEGSTAYHRLVLEIFFFYALAELRAAGEPNGVVLEPLLGPDLYARLHRMFEVLHRLLTPEGRLMFVGDNDSGRVHVLMDREDADLRYLLDLGAMLFGHPSFKVEEWERAPEGAWLFGFSGLDRMRAGKGVSKARLLSNPPGGSNLITLRGPADILLFNAMPNGTRGVGNHQHNDKLSFTLSVAGDDFFIDPGTLVYTPDPAARDRFRSTAFHSTVSVDRLEQNRFMPDSLFSLSDDARVQVEEWIENARVSAAHTGYARLSPPVRHRRTVERFGSPLGWTIEDELRGGGRRRLEWTFVVGPKIKVRLEGSATAVLEGDHGRLTMSVEGGPLDLQIARGEWAPAYGKTEETIFLRAVTEAPLPFSVRFNLRWIIG